MYHICFIHLSVDGHLGCFHVLAAVNNATMNMGETYLPPIIVLSRDMPGSIVLSRDLPRSIILSRDDMPGSELLGHSILSFLRNLQTVFHVDCVLLFLQ